MIYRHFKGKYYLRLPDTWDGNNPDKKYINYVPLYFERGFRVFTRTTEDFFTYIDRPNYSYVGSRFTKVSLTSLFKRS